MKGISTSSGGFAFSNQKRFRKRAPSLPDSDELVNGVLAGKRKDLAKAITFIESNSPSHYSYGQELLQKLLPKTGNSIRIGITGVPGVGKSTFIEAFGNMLCDLGLKTAVVAIDPSSAVSGGSILGDKTRMERLAKHPNAYIRPSPSSGTLGGVHRKTREVMLLCEAAGFEVILVETVGVGQSEFTVRGMVDLFMLLVLTGAGDELQGLKKGIMELADIIVVHKADGDNLALAHQTKLEYNQILKMLKPATKGWKTRACTCSSLKQQGIKELWEIIRDFEKTVRTNGVLEERRKEQTREWLHNLITEQLKAAFYQHPHVQANLPSIERKTMEGNMTPSQAAAELFAYVYPDKR
nr:methylmalonyl Co-A mutase-associated GTPase MeaB [Bacillus xiapuensis]